MAGIHLGDLRMATKQEIIKSDIETPYRAITEDGTEITVTFPCWGCKPKGLHCWVVCESYLEWL